MTVYILIRKALETETEAIYDFFPDADENRKGKLIIEKQTGEIKELESVLYDNKNFTLAEPQEKYFYTIKKISTPIRLAGHHSHQ